MWRAGSTERTRQVTGIAIGLLWLGSSEKLLGRAHNVSLRLFSLEADLFVQFMSSYVLLLSQA